MSHTSVGLGRVVSAQVDVFAAPTLARQQPGSVPGVIMCHGSGRVAVDITNPLVNGEYAIFDALRQKYCVGIGDFDYNAWGNNAAIADALATDTWMTTMGASSSKRVVVGASMGTATALNFAMNHPDRVSAVAVFIPVCDITSNPTEFAAAVNTAYGGTYNDTTMGPTNNPGHYAASFPTDIPVHLWYSTGDTTALPAQVEAFAAACPSATATVVSTTLDHSEAAIAAAPLADVLAFINTNLT